MLGNSPPHPPAQTHTDQEGVRESERSCAIAVHMKKHRAEGLGLNGLHFLSYRIPWDSTFIFVNAWSVYLEEGTKSNKVRYDRRRGTLLIVLSRGVFIASQMLMPHTWFNCPLPVTSLPASAFTQVCWTSFSFYPSSLISWCLHVTGLHSCLDLPCLLAWFLPSWSPAKDPSLLFHWDSVGLSGTWWGARPLRRRQRSLCGLFSQLY